MVSRAHRTASTLGFAVIAVIAVIAVLGSVLAAPLIGADAAAAACRRPDYCAGGGCASLGAVTQRAKARYEQGGWRVAQVRLIVDAAAGGCLVYKVTLTKAGAPPQVRYYDVDGAPR